MVVSAYAKSKIDWIVETTHPDNSAVEGSKLPDGKVVSSFKQDVQVGAYPHSDSDGANWTKRDSDSGS